MRETGVLLMPLTTLAMQSCATTCNAGVVLMNDSTMLHHVCHRHKGQEATASMTPHLCITLCHNCSSRLHTGAAPRPRQRLLKHSLERGGACQQCPHNVGKCGLDCGAGGGVLEYVLQHRIL